MGPVDGFDEDPFEAASPDEERLRGLTHDWDLTGEPGGARSTLRRGAAEASQ